MELSDWLPVLWSITALVCIATFVALSVTIDRGLALMYEAISIKDIVLPLIISFFTTITLGVLCVSLVQTCNVLAQLPHSAIH